MVLQLLQVLHTCAVTEVPIAVTYVGIYVAFRILHVALVVCASVVTRVVADAALSHDVTSAVKI